MKNMTELGQREVSRIQDWLRSLREADTSFLPRRADLGTSEQIAASFPGRGLLATYGVWPMPRATEHPDADQREEATQFCLENGFDLSEAQDVSQAMEVLLFERLAAFLPQVQKWGADLEEEVEAFGVTLPYGTWIKVAVEALRCWLTSNDVVTGARREVESLSGETASTDALLALVRASLKVALPDAALL